MNQTYLSSMNNTILSLKPSKAIRLLLMVLFVSLFANVASAATITSKATGGNWGQKTTWVGGVVPDTSDNVIIATTGTNQVTLTNDTICVDLTINTGSILDISDKDLAVNGNIILNGTCKSSKARGKILWNKDGGTLGGIGIFNNIEQLDLKAGTTKNIATAANITFTGANQRIIIGANNTITNNGIVTISGGQGFTTVATSNWVNVGTLNYGSTTNLLAIGTLTASAGGNTVNFTGVGAQTVKSTTYFNLGFSGAGTKTAAGNIIANNDFTLSAGNFVLNNGTSYTLTIGGDYLQTGGVFDFNSGTSATVAMYLAGNLTNSATVYSIVTSGGTALSGQIVFNGTITQNITYTFADASGYTTYILNAGSTVKLASNITLFGDNSSTKFYSDFIVNGIIDFGTFTLRESLPNGSHFALNSGAEVITANVDGITSAAALGSIQVPGRTFSSAASYTYNSSNAQVTGNGLPATISNLTVNNSAGVTLGRATTITNNFSITAGSKANLGTFTHIAGSLSFSEIVQIPESWGSTSSPADNKNDTYFASTTGLVNNSCTAPSITTQPKALTLCENTGGIFSVSTSVAGATYQWQYSLNNSTWINTNSLLGFSGHTAATVALTNISAVYNGYYVRCIVRSSTGCRANSNSALLTVSPALSAPTIGAITQPTCTTATGSVVLNGLPTGSWILTRSPGNVTTTGSGTSTTISGISSGTHSFSVIGTNSGTGLKGEYFNNMTISGAPALTRTDAMVNFDWVNGNPGTPVTNDGFSVKWSGQIQPLYSENYTFTTRSDDGIRLFVNGKQIINNWTIHAATNNTGEITLLAGVKYDIVLEYYESTGQAVSQLSWSSASQPFETIPQSQLYPNAINCSSPASANFIINALPVSPAITPNKVNETCPSNNNGTISPVLSGGLTNIRYIKLSQKYTVDAYQQVAEIEAFEIFTSTNVALSTTGAVATASSTYSTNYPASEVNDGVPAKNDNMWHSFSTTNEWVKIDLQSAKNIDYLKIYNRTDCCQERGQSMLLELFDAANNLVYSKTVDLWQSGTNVPVNIDILNVSWADSATTLNRTALDSGTYTLNYTDALGCSVSSPIVIGSTNAAPSVTVGTPTQPNCKTPTGTVNVTLPTPATGITYTITGTSPVVAAVTNATGVFSGLAAGNYNVTTSDGSCISAPVAVVINTFLLVTNKWQGALLGWSKGVPTENQNIEFTENYDSTGDLIACSCQVNTGLYVNINTGHSLILTNSISVVNSGNILFKDKSSLVQTNDVTNTGAIEYERKVSNFIRPSDYTYWSSPVAGFKLGDVYLEDATGLFYSYGVVAGIEDWQQELATKVMEAGKGYITNGAKPGGSSYTPPTFIGVPNNGTITFPIGFTGATAEGTSNLLGNPYPSAIDADKFLTKNKNVLDGTLYFWTHNTERGIGVSNAGTGVFAYSSDDYASYNFTGGVTAVLDSRTAIGNLPGGIVLSEIAANRPSGKIAAGQGFFATGKASGSVTFTNDMRVAGTSGNNSLFFKTKDLKGKIANTIEKNRVWLNLTNTEGAFKQTLIGYVTDATNDYDNLFDGESFDGNEFVDFYSVNQDKNLVIQGRALPFVESDEVPLGYRTTIDGNFTINIDEVDGSLTDQDVFIEDKLTNTVFNLKTGNYTFSTAPGTFNDRFVLKYMDTSKTLSVDTIEKEDGILAFYSNNYNTLIIHNDNFDEIVNSVALFNIAGQKIEVWDVSDSEQTNIQVPVKSISSGIYIVKVSTTKGESSKKIVVN